ncbi:hypothetical protein E2986_12297 [Frieseomelitta varia]|uniref:Uncharacterized protein n=1 Tax=Frieseomelitta varia TaxID=561572 RepID=A0A833SDY8_9HYME|nr:hypothetical protein E2986_12297 [Frieseomelitta varia]
MHSVQPVSPLCVRIPTACWRTKGSTDISVRVTSVFWDLYSAAPERRDSCEHSSEAKAFHDYVSIVLLLLDMMKL